LFWKSLEMPKKSVVASWRPQLSPVKSSRASLVRMTLHLRGETGLWLKTRAVEHRQRASHVIYHHGVSLSLRVVGRAYRPGRRSSCQSGQRRRRLRASCPWCSQCSARGGRSFRRWGVWDGDGGSRWWCPNVAFANGVAEGWAPASEGRARWCGERRGAVAGRGARAGRLGGGAGWRIR
jgi:hypothetical protein